MNKEEIKKAAAVIALMRKQRSQDRWSYSKKLLEELINDRSLNPIQVARAFSKETGERITVMQLGKLIQKYGLIKHGGD